MKRRTIILLVPVAAVAVALFLLRTSGDNDAGRLAAPDTRNGTYRVEGEAVTLTGTFAYFGNEAEGDLNGDGIPDRAFLFTDQPGGSGTFFYVAALVSTPQGWQGTGAVLVGDRIAPQTTDIENGVVIVNYADRKPGEPFSAQPSVGVSLSLRLSGMNLVRTVGAY